VIPLVKQAIRLSPRDPHVGTWYYLIGSVHLLQSRTDEAIVWLEKARSAMPTDPFHHNRLGRRLCPQRRILGHGGECQKTRALYEATYFAGLRKAGLPEE